MRAFNLLSNIDLAEEKRSEPYRGNIGDIPASMLYDLCNAFPTLLHEWLWLVLEVLKIPTVIVKVIERLYSNIFAYSSGCGDGSFLFEVLGGVKTCCPLSSILFLLGVNPFIDLFLWLSDGPKCSVTRICADDLGSALKCLKSLKTQASIFRAAANYAGLILKPAKCVLVVTACELSEHLITCIRNWLGIHVPEFKDIVIASLGKFVGWTLGRQSAILSWESPIKNSAIECRRSYQDLPLLL